MTFNKFYFILINLLFIVITLPASARCVVCYTNGMSGASIAVIVLISSFIILFFANKVLKKIINKR